MSIVNKFFSQTVDNLFLSLAVKKKCNKLLEDDLFDGVKYSVDEFYEKYSCYYDKPWEFFTDFRSNGIINLSKGKHFNAILPSSNTNNYEPYLFESPFKTQWRENNLVPFYWYKGMKRSKVILLFAHGWARPNYIAEHMVCSGLSKNGIDAAILTAPFHLERKPKESKYSGEYFISANIFWSIINFRHYASEIRQVIQYMRNQYEYIGVIGMSSGGFQASLALTAEVVDFYFPFITGAKLGSITWNGKLTTFVKSDLIRKGVDESILNKAWSITDQLYVGKHCKAKYIKHYISLYDEIVPTEYQNLLWEVYGKKDRLDLECAHTSVIFKLDKIINDILKTVKGIVV